MAVVLECGAPWRDWRQLQIWDDFTWYVDAQQWTKLATGSGATVAESDTYPGGQLKLTTGATGGNEAGFATTNSPFFFTTSKPLSIECMIGYVDASTNQIGIAFGFASTLNTTGFMTSDGTALLSSWTGAILYKLAGQTNWSFATSIGTTILTNVTTQIAGSTGQLWTSEDSYTSGAPYAQKLRIDITDQSPYQGQLNCTPFINDQQCLDNSSGLKINQNLALIGASPAAMQAGVYTTAGNSNSQISYVDYIVASLRR